MCQRGQRLWEAGMNRRLAIRFGLFASLSLILAGSLTLYAMAKRLEAKRTATIKEISNAIRGQKEIHLRDRLFPRLLDYISGVSPFGDVFSSRSFYLACVSRDGKSIHVRGIDLSSCRSLAVSLNGSQWTPSDVEREGMVNLSYYYLMREFDIFPSGDVSLADNLVVNGQKVTVESSAP